MTRGDKLISEFSLEGNPLENFLSIVFSINWRENRQLENFKNHKILSSSKIITISMYGMQIISKKTSTFIT